MSMYNRSKFNFSETFNNASGKTSGSGFVGVILGMIAGVGIVSGIIGYFLQIPNTLPFMEVILKLVAAVTILLGLRKLSGDFNSKNLAEADATIAKTIAENTDASTGEKG
jgi:ABC-type dipeptide/oligopeptide/nickel transport system permease subunit